VTVYAVNIVVLNRLDLLDEFLDLFVDLAFGECRVGSLVLCALEERTLELSLHALSVGSDSAVDDVINAVQLSVLFLDFFKQLHVLVDCDSDGLCLNLICLVRSAGSTVSLRRSIRKTLCFDSTGR